MDDISILATKAETTGHVLEAELLETVNAISTEAAERDAVVQSRLAALEAEAAALQRVQVLAEAAQTAAKRSSEA